MNATRPRIAVVEDNPTQRTILERLLDKTFDIGTFEHGDQFLAAPPDFDAVLLDIEMPGRNGYETCRALRAAGHTALPVIFVSAHDTIPERVAAYEAGGDDFLTKPISAHELLHKIHSIIEHRDQVQQLSAQSSMAQQVAFTAMSSISDQGVVIEFLRRSALCRSYDSIARQLMEAMQAWGLRGAVQIRGRNGTVSLSAEARMSPLQLSVLENMRGMGRIFEMGSRAIINYERVSLLIENLPTHDPDKVGRLRDHLAVLAESSDMTLAGMDAVQERDLQKVGIHGALTELRETLSRLAERKSRNREIGQFHMLEALEQLSRAMTSLGLTESQRNYIDDLVKCTLDDTRHYFDEAANLDTEFAELDVRLARLAVSDYRL